MRHQTVSWKTICDAELKHMNHFDSGGRLDVVRGAFPTGQHPAGRPPRNPAQADQSNLPSAVKPQSKEKGRGKEH
jgi:hypothetical protein